MFQRLDDERFLVRNADAMAIIHAPRVISAEIEDLVLRIRCEERDTFGVFSSFFEGTEDECRSGLAALFTALTGRNPSEESFEIRPMRYPNKIAIRSPTEITVIRASSFRNACVTQTSRLLQTAGQEKFSLAIEAENTTLYFYGTREDCRARLAALQNAIVPEDSAR